MARRLGVLLPHHATRAIIHNARYRCGPGEGDRDGRAAFRHAGRDRGTWWDGAYPPRVESRKSLIVGESLGVVESLGVAGSRRVGGEVAPRESLRVGESPESRSAVKVEKPLRVDLRRHLPESRITTAEKPKHSLKTPLESLLEVFASHRRHKKTPLGSPKGVYRSFSGVSESGSRGGLNPWCVCSKPRAAESRFRRLAGKHARPSSSSSPYASSSSTTSAFTACASGSTPAAARYLPAISAGSPASSAGRSVLWVTTVSLGASLQPRFDLE